MVDPDNNFDPWQNKDTPWRDEQTLREIWYREDLTIGEISDELGCNRVTLYRWAEKYGLEKRSEKFDEWNSFDKLMELYWDERLSTAEIAERVECTQPTVSRWLREHDIPTRYTEKKSGNMSTTRRGYVYFTGGDAIVWIHQLLAIAKGYDPHKVFSDGYNIHHKNQIPFDNRPENIDLLTVAEHTNEHREALIENRTYHNPAVDSDLCQRMRQEYKDGATMAELADEYDAGPTTVRYHIRDECSCEE